jgi:hypothetical protein
VLQQLFSTALAGAQSAGALPSGGGEKHSWVAVPPPQVGGAAPVPVLLLVVVVVVVPAPSPPVPLPPPPVPPDVERSMATLGPHAATSETPASAPIARLAKRR